MEIVIGRYINGIALNGVEYLINDNGDLVHFESKEKAKDFLRDNGIESEDDLEDCFVYKIHTFCLNCGHEYFLNLSEIFEDELGKGYSCKKCGASFDV